jgi:hypothetical protein
MSLEARSGRLRLGSHMPDARLRCCSFGVAWSGRRLTGRNHVSKQFVGQLSFATNRVQLHETLCFTGLHRHAYHRNLTA